METLYAIAVIGLVWYLIRGAFEMNHHSQVARRARTDAGRTDYQDPIA